MKFYLGIHKPNWLLNNNLVCNTFLSYRQLCKYKKLSPVLSNWGLDSGGFSELSINGFWSISESQYVTDVKRFMKEIGNLDFVSPQDWMCEPYILKKTGKNVKEHIYLTIKSYLNLMNKDIPVIPVIQGFTTDEYTYCIDQYYQHNINLDGKMVAVGSVCRRQSTKEAVDIFSKIRSLLKKSIIHGFGIKTKGIPLLKNLINSSDSMAWSFNARKNPALEMCKSHKNCANCIIFAEKWLERLKNKFTFLELY